MDEHSTKAFCRAVSSSTVGAVYARRHTNDFGSRSKVEQNVLPAALRIDSEDLAGFGLQQGLPWDGRKTES